MIVPNKFWLLVFEWFVTQKVHSSLSTRMNWALKWPNCKARKLNYKARKPKWKSISPRFVELMTFLNCENDCVGEKWVRECAARGAATTGSVKPGPCRKMSGIAAIANWIGGISIELVHIRWSYSNLHFFFHLQVATSNASALLSSFNTLKRSQQEVQLYFYMAYVISSWIT